MFIYFLYLYIFIVLVFFIKLPGTLNRLLCILLIRFSEFLQELEDGTANEDGLV